IINLKSYSVYDKISVQLPKNSKYNESMTEDLEQGDIEFSYNSHEHSLELKWDGTKQSALFVLTNLPSTYNKLKVRGIVENKVKNEEIHSFQIADAESKKQEQESDDNAESKKQKQESDDNAESKKQEQESDDNAESKKQEQESDDNAESKKQEQESYDNAESKQQEQESDDNAETNKELFREKTIDDNSSNNDLNTFVGIEPVFKNVLSGDDAKFRLTLKLTGSKRTYKNVDVTIDLPITKYITFNDDQEDLDRLAIDGVSPAFDSETNQLKYHFDEIKRGQMHEKIISLNTVNGYIPDDKTVDINVSISGDVHYTENDEKEEAQKGDVVPFEYED